MDPWQSLILCDWMGRDAAGRWAASTCGGSVSRQNGKSYLVQGRAEPGMLLFNEQVIYTAHLQKTATETFGEMRDFFESKRIAPYVDDIKSAIGREQIILKSGARIKFLARTRNGGRGQHGDLLIFDEAQELDADQQASFLPAISASLNPQAIYIGTPPGPDVTGTVFREIRGRALSGTTDRMAWYEFSVGEIGDVKDRARWALTNPALGRRILLSTIEGEVEQMSPDTFARERLGWWSPVASAQLDLAIDKDSWSACMAAPDLKPEGKTAFGVKFSPDGSEVCLCGAVLPKTGPAWIAMIDRQGTGRGTQWLADWLNAHSEKASCVVIDGRNGSDVLVDKISEVWRAKGSVVRPSVRDVLASVSMVTDGLAEKSIAWPDNQPALQDSALSAIKRPIGGGWGFGGPDSTPIEAAALALWGVKTSRRDPSRRMRIG